MLIGYARVSTEDQHLDLQQALAPAGCRRVFVDCRSGAKADRPGLLGALGYARPGDCVAVWRLDRLGRSLPNLIAGAPDGGGRHAAAVSDRGHRHLDRKRAAYLHLFASLPEFERALVRERTLGGYRVVDASCQAVCFIYGKDRSKGVSGTSLSVDEARRIAAGIARPPELLGRRRHPTR